MTERADSVTVHLVDVDLRAAISALGPYLDRPVVFGALPVTHVTLETPRPVARVEVPKVLGGLIAAQNLELSIDSTANVYRVRAHDVAPVASIGSGRSASSSAGAAPELFVIRLSHARAADVAATVNALYGRASALGEPGGGRLGRSLSTELAQNQLPPTLPTGAAAQQAVASVAGRSASFSGETTIVPDAGTNSLLVRANAADFDLIAAAVKQLDIRPLQVLIEVLIAEVSKNATWSFGVTTTAPQQGVSGTNTSIGGTLAGLASGDFALTVMHMGGLAITSQLNLAAQKGEARILSRPVVLAQNNQEAEILVGSQQPFIQVQQTQVGAVAQNQVVQYQDVGTKLTVRPTISADGYVQLDVSQEVNEATGEFSFNAPVISTRTVRTRLLVRDSQTVVLGGLSSREKDRSSEGIPVLSSIPIFGGLFGQTSRTSTDTEFFLFLTPRIVASDNDAARATEPIERGATEHMP